MRDVNLINTASTIRSVAQNNYIVPQAKCNWEIYFKQVIDLLLYPFQML